MELAGADLEGKIMSFFDDREQDFGIIREWSREASELTGVSIPWLLAGIAFFVVFVVLPRK